MLRYLVNGIQTWKLGHCIKILITLFFFYVIFYKVPWYEWLETIKNANLFFIFLSFLLSPIMVLVSVWKWYILLRAQKQSASFTRLLGLYYIGYLFNYLLPSSTGGDFIISYELAKYTKANYESVASVFMNRFTGLIVLMLASLTSFMINLSLLTEWNIVFAMGSITLGSIFTIWSIIDKRLLSFLERFLGGLKHENKFILNLKKMQQVLLVYKNDIGTLLASILISIIFFMLMVLNIYLGCLAFHVFPSFISLIIIIPFIQLVSMLPISLGGIGVKDLAYVIAFPQVGISSSVGLSVSLLIHLKGIISGCIGGIIYPLLMKNG